MNVQDLIARVLETVNGNQAEAARRLGRSETTISRWVNGQTGIDYESALRIARMTGLPPRLVLEAAGLDPEVFPETSAQPELDAKRLAMHADLHRCRHSHATELLAELPGAEIQLRSRLGQLSKNVLDDYVTTSDQERRTYRGYCFAEREVESVTCWPV